MDIISTIYKELFQIKLVHKAFNNANGTQLFQQVTAVPDMVLASTKVSRRMMAQREWR